MVDSFPNHKAIQDHHGDPEAKDSDGEYTLTLGMYGGTYREMGRLFYSQSFDRRVISPEACYALFSQFLIIPSAEKKKKFGIATRARYSVRSRQPGVLHLFGDSDCSNYRMYFKGPLSA